MAAMREVAEEGRGGPAGIKDHTIPLNPDKMILFKNVRCTSGAFKNRQLDGIYGKGYEYFLPDGAGVRGGIWILAAGA